MPPPRECRRTCAPRPPVPELPACLLSEIAARTDAATIFRFAATCKLLRREILSADFVRRVCQGPGAVVPSRTLGVLGETFSVVHPVTAATAALGRYFARSAAGRVLRQYVPLRSRDGLVVLRHRRLPRPGSSERRPAGDLCVRDPMGSGSRGGGAFLPFPPDIDLAQFGGVLLLDYCALLTAADGIGCSFMLLAADMARNDLDGGAGASSSARVRVQTARSSPDSSYAGWGPVRTIDRHPCPRWCTNRDTHSDAGVVASGGGVVHWLLHCGISSSPSLQRDGAVGEYILTYDASAAAVGSVGVPMGRRHPELQGEPALPSRLASSPDGRLSFVAADGGAVLVWVLSDGGSWAHQRHVAIDLRELAGPPQWALGWRWTGRPVELEQESFFGDRSAVLLRFGAVRFLLHMEKGGTDPIPIPTCLGRETAMDVPYEVDLASRLLAASMKLNPCS